MSHVVNTTSFTKGAAGKGMAVLRTARHALLDKHFKELPPRVQRGLMRDLSRQGVDSISGLLTGLIPHKRTRETLKKTMTRHIGVPALKADIAAGKALQKVTPFKNMFKIREKVPLGGKLYEEINRPSGLAPATKVMQFAVPIAGGMAIEDKIDKLMGDNNMKKQANKATVTLEKTAAVKLATELIRLQSETSKLAQANTSHEKRAKAEKLVYKQASLGLTNFPQSYEELQEKVASLANQDLDVVEKALEFQVGDVHMGQLHNSFMDTPISTTPEGQFAASLLGDDVF